MLISPKALLACASLSLASCSGLIKPTETGILNPPKNGERISTFNLLNYLEPQDTFEHIQKRLISQIEKGKLELKKDDLIALRTFIYGQEADGSKAALIYGQGNQLTAIVQGIFCLMPQPDSNQAYLKSSQISGFFDDSLRKAYQSWARSNSVEITFSEKTDKMLIEGSQLLKIIEQANRAGIINLK